MPTIAELNRAVKVAAAVPGPELREAVNASHRDGRRAVTGAVAPAAIPETNTLLPAGPFTQVTSALATLTSLASAARNQLL